MKKEYAEEVAAQIIKQLQQGTAPWQKPWQPGEYTLPYNAATGNEYRGINSMYLAMQDRSDPRWMTYNQASDAGAQVRKGSKGTKIIYWKFRDERQERDEQGRPVKDENGKPKMISVELERPRAFHAVVFNAEQIDGLPPLEPKILGPEPERLARAEAILSNSGAKIHHVAGDRAFYRPSTDDITLPERNQFHSTDAYYATALHELGHWTGHPSRLNRDLAHPFGSEGYAREELRAEIASLMLGERLEIGHDPGQHAAYVESWVKILKDDPREIFRAASDAERISRFVMDFEQEQAQEKQQETAPQQPAQVAEPVAQQAIQQDAPAAIKPVLHDAPEGTKAMTGRTYLAVPYAEKDEAKAVAQAAGFRLGWDKTAKSWYAPEGANLDTLQKWNPDSPRVVESGAKKSPEEQFAEALADAGLIVQGTPIMDGQIHRVQVEGDKGSQRSGAYAGHLVGRMPGGYIQNFKTGENVNWKAEGAIDSLTPEEKARLAAEAAQRQQQRETNRTQQQERTAVAAAALWAESPAATEENDYCKAKGIKNPGAKGLRTVPDAPSPAAAALGIRIAKTAGEAKAMREADKDARVFKAGDLLVPGYDKDGKLWTLQTVNPYFKSFMKEGRKSGLFTVAGANPDGKTVADLFGAKDVDGIVAEGYATADSVARLTGQPVVVAFDSGNLNAVTGTLREQFPDKRLLIAADNDHNAPNEVGPNGRPKENVGMAKAKEAAENHGAGVIAPQFQPGDKGSDWNDVEAAKGESEARKELAEQLAVAKRDAAIISERLTTLARTRDMEARNDPSTSADDAEVAAERGKAASMLVSAAEQNTQVRSASADGLVGTKGARSGKTAKAGVERKTETLRDAAKAERQDVLSPAQQREKEQKEEQAKQQRQPRRRSRGADLGM